MPHKSQERAWNRKYQKRMNKLVHKYWWGMDTTIAHLVAKTCDKYIVDRHGNVNPLGWDKDNPWEPELLDACTGLVYIELRDLALEWANHYGDEDNGFPDALAECMRLGYLWD